MPFAGSAIWLVTHNIKDSRCPRTLQAMRIAIEISNVESVCEHASNSTSPLFSDSGFSASGLARIRWRATRVAQSAPRAPFSLVAGTGNIAGMRNWLRNVDEIQRVCYHGRTNKPSKRNCSQRSNSTVHRSIAGISRWVDDELWASQASFARSPHHRAHRR
jgi:hypothetical protein